MVEAGPSTGGRSRPMDNDFIVGDDWSSDDEDDDVLPAPNEIAAHNERVRERRAKRASTRRNRNAQRSFNVDMTWDALREDEHGSLEGAVQNALLGHKRRVLRDTTSIQKGIIRHVYLVIDTSYAMLTRDFKLSWIESTVAYAKEFITEFFDQNPISQLAIITTREGGAEKLSSLSGNPTDHLKALDNKRKLECRGEPSLQNALELARTGLSHLPTHTSREIVVVFGSLTTCDPGNIHNTLDALVRDRIRVNIIGLFAEMRICKDICTATRGTYHVAKDDVYLREHLFEFVTPPPTFVPQTTAASAALAGSATKTNTADLMMMGFPSIVVSNATKSSSGGQSSLGALCACHSKLREKGFECPRCASTVCDVPSQCVVCKLTLVSAPHLARSWRHLFPVDNYEIVNGPTAAPSSGLDKTATDGDGGWPDRCFACAFAFPPNMGTANPEPTGRLQQQMQNGLSPTGRYRCPKCLNQFCLDCDVWIHNNLGVCPGCA